MRAVWHMQLLMLPGALLPPSPPPPSIASWNDPRLPPSWHTMPTLRPPRPPAGQVQRMHGSC
jgi:hypothetical protein